MAHIKNHSYSSNPYMQFIDRNGKPLTNGTLTTFIAGTTTPVTTYKDWNKTENPATITLDENGGCTIILNDALRYKFEIRTEDGALYKTFDNVDGNGVGNKEIVNQQVVVEGGYGIITESRTEDGVTYYKVIVNTDQVVSKQEYDPFKEQITSEVLKKIDDAPADGNKYARKDKEWVVIDGDATVITSEDESVSVKGNTAAGVTTWDLSIKNKLDNKKDKQSAVVYTGNNTRTITELQQDENGKIVNVIFSDIDIPQEVPNIEIESNTLEINSNIDPVTNTKTFKIELEGSELDYYNAGKDKGTVINMNNNALWLPLANQDNLYGSKGITLNSDYTRANLDPNKKYLCVAEIHWDVNSYNIADTIARLSLNYQIGQRTTNPIMTIEIDMSMENDGYRYISWLTEGADWTGIYAGLFDNKGKTVRVTVRHFFIVEQSAISGGGSGTTYTAGDGIDIGIGNKINVNAGNGLEITTDNKLQVKLGKGLKFDTEAGIEGEISIDDIGQEVIEEVQELASELDKKITTTFNYAQITSAEDFATFGVQGTTRLIGQLFAVPISSEIRENDTLICIRAKQSYAGKLSFGIFEFDFDGNEGSGSTTWLCDTGVVSIKAGENQFKIKNIIPTSTVRPVIKMEPGKLYYATILMANDAPAAGLYLASCAHYDQNYNATPKYTMLASNMDSYVDWTNGSQRNTWFEGYNEFNNIPRLFMMIRNGAAAPIPTIEPFSNYDSFTLEHKYRVNDLFSLTINADNQPVLYQKIRPAHDCKITKIGWVDYHSGATYESGSDIPLMIDSNYTSITRFSDNVESSSGTKIDGVHYYHEFTLSTPIDLIADTNYFVPCNMKIIGADSEWIITYASPANASKDLILFDSKWNVASWAGNHAEYLSNQPCTLCRLFTDDGKVYTF